MADHKKEEGSLLNSEEDSFSAGMHEWSPPAPIRLGVPAPEELLEGVEVPRWLADRARRLYRSAELLERVESVGFVARLGAATAEAPGDLFAALVAGHAQSPGARARRWAASLDEAVTKELARLLVDAADLLRDNIAGLRELAAEGGEPARRAARAECYGRDELESVSWVLVAAGRGDEVAGTLEALDQAASGQLTALDLVLDADDDDLLSTIAWQAPDAWWGARQVCYVCAWCGAILRSGSVPASHGICLPCHRQHFGGSCDT
jgi:hypothetical protein